MSHITTSEAKIIDIDALRAAVATFGGTLEQRSTFMSYESGHACDYAICLPGVKYQVGVQKQHDSSYRLAYDSYGYDQSATHDGHKLIAKFGEGLAMLRHAYTEATIRKQAKMHGYSLARTVLPNGDVRLRLTPGAGKGYGYQKVTA